MTSFKKGTSLRKTHRNRGQLAARTPEDAEAGLAKLFDLYATIRPDKSRGGSNCELVANIPLERQSNKLSGYDMIISPSDGKRGR